MFFVDFPPSQNMAQGHFIVGTKHKSAGPKILGPVDISIMGCLRCRTLNLNIKSR